jgi:hypothetical protein
MEGGDGGFLASGVESFAEEQEAGGVVGDCKRIAIAAVAELEFAFEIGAPEVVGVETG